ncbi:hypothetical protein DFJ73DRAFT_843444 [Zopfochytrium polystomum]|nr:hypothetical protein DFJ73DRAFT_843444 [Zopfochytrium polystomum]
MSAEGFLLLAKSARGGACAQLIQDVLSAPGIFSFAELLEMKNIAELRNNPQLAMHHKLLEIFSFGTYLDYKKIADTLPPLTDVQRKKLRLLSIVSFAGEKRSLSYESLQEQLDVANVRELEDLIIDGIYQDVLAGRLDQKKKCLEVEYGIGRDLPPGETAKLLNSLSSWANTTENILRYIDQKLEAVAREMAAHTREKEEFEKALEEAKAKAKAAGSGQRMAAVSEFDPAFDGRRDMHSLMFEADERRGGKSRVSKGRKQWFG